MSKKESKTPDIIIYKTDDGLTEIEVNFEGQSVYLSQAQMAELFQSSKSNISEHIKNVFAEGELVEDEVVRFFRTTTPHGAMPDKTQTHTVKYYNIDVIIAVGYRVKSARGTQFRQWATKVLHEYLQKGFAMNDKKLKNAGGGLYFKELLERIRDIRASEKVLYRQVLDLYATSLDYSPKSDETYQFFRIVQAKMHYAASGQTPSEIIFNRANADLPFMGLTVFDGKRPVKSEVTVAKNYLTDKELFSLRRLVNAFFDLAELKAIEQEPMYMKDWVKELDRFTANYGKGVLTDSGSVSEMTAHEKAELEYSRYKKKKDDELTEVENEYLLTLENMRKLLNASVSEEAKKKGGGGDE